MSQQIELPLGTLKARELEVLRLIVEGRSNQEIAAQLMIEVTTVRWHNKQIYSKLGVHSRTLLIARARELGLPDAGVAAGALQVAGRSAIPSAPRSNLPAQTTSFIGREREIAKARQLLATSRLLTLTGPGGSGKTRLALEVARTVSGEYAEGVWFVSLASVLEPRVVAATIAGVLKITESTTESVDESLVKYVRDKQMLLVIDNFEHLISASPLLATLLANAPSLKMVVTSREVVRLYGEQEYPVPPLTMPELTMADGQHFYDLQELMGFEAVQLFQARARAGSAAFQISRENVDAVAEICHRLDGLPLAIELAAARIKMLGPQLLLARLIDDLGALGQGPRDAPARQRTLRATIDWSYTLLNEEERGLLCRLALFQGGWTLEAMEAICEGGDEFTALDGLSSLLDKSLVQTVDEAEGEPRFKLLETVRQYALEKLSHEDIDATKRRHRDYFLRLAEAATKGLETRDAPLWYERLRQDEDNLYAALAWCQEQLQEEAEGAEVGLRLAGALWHYWHVRGTFREGRGWLIYFLAHAQKEANVERARALNGAGMLAYRQGEYAEVARLCGEALEIGQAIGETGAVAFALHYLAHVAQEQGRYGEAEEMLARSMSLFRELGSTWGCAESLNCLGDLQRQLGRYAEATVMLEEALALRRSVNNRRGTAVTLGNLGHALCRQGEAARAAAYFRESLEIAEALHNRLFRMNGLIGFADVAGVQEEARRSALLLGAAWRLLAEAGYELEPPDRVDFELVEKQARGQMAERAFEAAWDEGGKMSLEQAIVYALSTVDAGG